MRTKILYISIGIALFMIITSCRSKKEITNHKTTSQSEKLNSFHKEAEVVFQDRVVEKTKPVMTNIIIERPCDSLGNLLPVNYSAGSGGNTAKVYSKDGQLHIEMKIDSISNYWKEYYHTEFVQDTTAYRSNYVNDQVSTSKVRKTVWPWWLWVLLIGAVAWIAISIYMRVIIPIRR